MDRVLKQLNLPTPSPFCQTANHHRKSMNVISQSCLRPPRWMMAHTAATKLIVMALH